MPTWQIAERPFEFLFRPLIDDVNDGPGDTFWQQITCTVEQPRNAKSTNADQGEAASHRSRSHNVMADEMRIGGIDKAPMRRYWRVVTSIPRLRTSESQSMVASEP